ncbi:hypothetical protein L3Q65_00920 (plasmid) [Amycolatopsis sp. FU40]|uniref:hypothetical protein n=1 Tax=Amycolatopsis sp. FU40 TaxID=2914159 RepID=UPI001F2C9F97|nr:hypothetical protein [Amycolatopsis sp. FU40]UKD50887.1 hypothetical protein L3Q65_00920 [Amycolatopsis sp. FU40]
MNLTDAIKLVADDTRESTDSSMTDHEAIASARTITRADLDVVDDAKLNTAYRTVLAASAPEIASALS